MFQLDNNNASGALQITLITIGKQLNVPQQLELKRTVPLTTQYPTITTQCLLTPKLQCSNLQYPFPRHTRPSLNCFSGGHKVPHGTTATIGCNTCSCRRGQLTCHHRTGCRAGHVTAHKQTAKPAGKVQPKKEKPAKKSKPAKKEDPKKLIKAEEEED